MPKEDFTFVGSLGKGSFGEVMKVVRRNDGEKYAVKKIKIKNMRDKEVGDALNEIRFLASIRHENIIGYYESFVDKKGSTLFIVMEYAGGGDLEHLVKKHRKKKKWIKEDKIWYLFSQLMNGIEHLHELQVLHRDIKTANLFLTKTDVLKIGDLNVSKLMKRRLQACTQIGTPYYMAPEIWRHEKYGTGCDIWSAGCVLYELAALRPPFLGRDAKDLSRNVARGRFAPIPYSFSQDLKGMLKRILRLNPSQRPSATKLRNSKMLLAAALPYDTNGGSVGAPPSTACSRASSMLDTICVPRNKQRISHRLPKPCYPDSRPDSPEAWPMSSRSAPPPCEVLSSHDAPRLRTHYEKEPARIEVEVIEQPPSLKLKLPQIKGTTQDSGSSSRNGQRAPRSSGGNGNGNGNVRQRQQQNRNRNRQQQQQQQNPRAVRYNSNGNRMKSNRENSGGGGQKSERNSRRSDRSENNKLPGIHSRKPGIHNRRRNGGGGGGGGGRNVVRRGSGVELLNKGYGNGNARDRNDDGNSGRGRGRQNSNGNYNGNGNRRANSGMRCDPPRSNRALGHNYYKSDQAKGQGNVPRQRSRASSHAPQAVRYSAAHHKPTPRWWG